MIVIVYAVMCFYRLIIDRKEKEIEQDGAARWTG